VVADRLSSLPFSRQKRAEVVAAEEEKTTNGCLSTQSKRFAFACQGEGRGREKKKIDREREMER
jgi:hypothetical protein